MAKCSMRRIEIAALMNDGKKLVERLQRRGVIEICDCRDERLVKVNTQAAIGVFEKSLNLALEAQGILKTYVLEKASLLDSFKGKRELHKDAFGELADAAEKSLKKCFELSALSKKVHDRREEISRLRTQIDQLSVWKELDIPMALRGTEHTRAFIGTLPGDWTSEELTETLCGEEQLSALYAEVISSSKEQSRVVVLCHASIGDDCENALRERGFAQPADPTHHKPEIRLGRMKDRIAQCEEDIRQAEEEIRSFADCREEIEFLIDYYTMRKEKYEILNRLAMSSRTMILTGYIPEKEVDRLVKELNNRFSIAISVAVPQEDEDVPVLLENNGFASPVEPITEMYALPNKQDIDPTPVMAFFYYLFFGMMLSDAGYGCLMVLVSAVALKKFPLEGNMKKTMKMFLYSGVSTIAWGALFGTWFGDIVPVIFTNFLHKPSPEMALWFNPVQDPMKLLLFSLGLGILHLFLGLGVHFYQLWKNGKKWDAFCDVIPICLLVLGAAPLGAGMLVSVNQTLKDVGKYLLLLGVILIILTASRSSKNIFARLGGGLYGLYNAASGYLGDVLSYSRLLALGLATGIIGQVVNLLGTIPQNPVVKAALLVVVFLVGHTLNLAINLLGAYVHTNRLQYVELFSKFYEGGGRPFTPFGVHTKYIRFKEETSHE